MVGPIGKSTPFNPQGLTPTQGEIKSVQSTQNSPALIDHLTTINDIEREKTKIPPLTINTVQSI
ncbi:MAG: hypothetical protein Tsb0021_01270 [Chlamydiales bacterium]